MSSKLLVVAVLALAVVATTVVAKDACNGKPFGTAGDFDYYVYAQSWSAQFCTAHKKWPGCANPTPFMAHNLTLHGLWPNYGAPRSGHGWPQCCPSSFGSDIDPQVVHALLPDLQQYWPNEQDPTGKDLSNSLWAHEWGKHGTCSGLDQKTYLQTAMDIEIANPTPRAITDNIGSYVALSELQKAFNATGCGSGPCWTGFQCSKQNGQLYLAGVASCYDPRLNRIACSPAALASQGQQCTADKVYILSF